MREGQPLMQARRRRRQAPTTKRCASATWRCAPCEAPPAGRAGRRRDDHLAPPTWRARRRQDPLMRADDRRQQQLLRVAPRRAGGRPAGDRGKRAGPARRIESPRTRHARQPPQASWRCCSEELNNTRGLVQEGYAPRNRQLELERDGRRAHGLAGRTAGQPDARAPARDRRAAPARPSRAAGVPQGDRRRSWPTCCARCRPTARSSRAAGERPRPHRHPRAGQPARWSASRCRPSAGWSQPAQKLMDIVPDDEPLLLETRVPPHLIDRVHAGPAGGHPLPVVRAHARSWWSTAR